MSEISQLILDVGMNMLSHQADSIEISIRETNGSKPRVEITVIDDGRFEADAPRSFDFDQDYFERSRGLQRLHALAKQCNGRCAITHIKTGGTKVSAMLNTQGDALPPIGDVPRMMMCLTAANPYGRIRLVHTVDRRRYEYDTAGLRARLHKISLHDPQDIMRIRSEMSEQERTLRAG
ncbi:MAG: ATP-binding protein [Candidatus Alcyoniella australis]|nr:ATP-binding protein [Candidatus Alcyoniella australis]